MIRGDRTRYAFALVLACVPIGCGKDDDGARRVPSPTPAVASTASPSATDSPTPPPSATRTLTVTPSPTPTVEPNFEIRVSEPRFVVPSAALPPEVEPLTSNNNVDIDVFDGRLFLAWRTAPTHFASPDTRMVIVSSLDQGVTWQLERVIQLGADVREPRFADVGGTLQLMFFEAGTNPGAFEPRRLLRTRRIGLGEWSDIEVLTDAGEVPWT